MDRRRFLCLSAAAGVGLASAPAAALSLEAMTEATKSSYLAACEAPSLHAELLAEIDAKLGGGGLTREQVAAVKAANRCPLCGCPLVEAELRAPGAAGPKN